MSRGLLTALLALLPITFLDFPVGSAGVTGFDITLLVGLLIFFVRVLTEQRYARHALATARLPTLRWARLMLLWFLVSLGMGVALGLPPHLSVRGMLSYVSFVAGLYLLPLIALTAMRAHGAEVIQQVFRRVTGIWVALILFGVLQEALFLADLPVNPMRISGPLVYPTWSIAGVTLLRPYSFFGEPREFASVVIPMLLMFSYVRGQTRLRTWQLILLAALGLLMAANTFIVIILIALPFLLLMDRGRYAGQWRYKASWVLVGTAAVVAGLGTQFGSIMPRLALVVRQIAQGSFEVGNYAFFLGPDLAIAPYLFDVMTIRVDPLTTIFGSGLGSVTVVIGGYFERFFGFDPAATGELLPSRLMIFNVLVETGLVGLVLFLATAVTVYKTISRSPLAERQRAMLKLILVTSFLGSMVQTSFFFVGAYILCLSAEIQTTTRESQEHQDDSVRDEDPSLTRVTA